MEMEDAGMLFVELTDKLRITEGFGGADSGRNKIFEKFNFQLFLKYDKYISPVTINSLSIPSGFLRLNQIIKNDKGNSSVTLNTHY
jgi:hypothetical protein